MEFTRQNPSARLVVPDKITVRQQLEYFSAATMPSAPLFIRLWEGALPLIKEWNCEIMPDKDIDIDQITDPQVTNVIVWAGLAIKKHLDSLDEIPKN